MAEFVASKAVKMMIKKKETIDESTVLILGITFKENCPDIRNTKVVDVYRKVKRIRHKRSYLRPLGRCARSFERIWSAYFDGTSFESVRRCNRCSGTS